MFDYGALETLELVTKEQSFVRAAKILFITQSAVSQRIKCLEEFVGRPLITRSPTIRPTLIGQQVLAHYRQVSLLEESIKRRWMGKRGPESPFPISIAINTETLSTWFIEAVKPTVKHSNIILDILIDDQERTSRFLQTGRVWGCVTSTPQAPYGCKVTFLGEMFYWATATPEFVEWYFKNGVTGKALLHAPAVRYGENDYMHMNYLRQTFQTYREGSPVLHCVPSPQGIMQFALDGLGYALLPETSIKKYLDKGQLVKLIPDKPYKLPLYWQTQELQTELTQELSQSIINHAKSVLVES